ncbi:MAG: transposase [Gammaproteobacteria bacterium]|nr:transposase [Gammaproteobacteria bacterium]
MSGFIEGACRTQATLFPDRLDDYITVENDIRVIDAFINSLDLSSLEFKTIPADTGRPAYHPSTMLRLFVYGYLNRIQSSRRLERKAGRNVELMWLLGRLPPDFKTIADFRKDNGKGIKNTCREFIGLCRQLNMFTDAVVAIDGSKFKAVNSKENNYAPKKLQFHIDRVERHIDEYLKQLDDLMAAMPESMLIRKQTVEHPFGTIKSWMGSTHFLTRGFKNVRTEMNLHVLAYNLKRMMSIHGQDKLIAAMMAWGSSPYLHKIR